MKKKQTKIVVIILILSFLSIVNANAVENIIDSSDQTNISEIRSSVISDSPYVVITAMDFSGFWYDLDDNLCSELLTITNISGRTILEEELTYNTSILQVDYEANFASEDSSSSGYTYPIISLFGEEYIPTDDADAGELVKLLLDSDDKHVIKVGSAFELSNGFSLTAKQLDVEGDKVWMEFSRNGELIESEVLDLTSGEVTWDYDTDVGNQNDVIVLRLLVTDIFQGTEESIVVIEGIYLLDYQDVLKLESGDEFGELEVDSISSTVEMSNNEPINLSMGQNVVIAEGLKFKVADDNNLRFYLLKENTEPGTYKLRGNVATGGATWNAENFAGFWYDLDNNLGSETLAISTNLQYYSRTIEENELIYNTSIVQAEYAANFSDEYNILFNSTYSVIGLFGEKYVSLSDTSPDKLVKLLVDNDEKYMLRLNSTLELPGDLSLTTKQLDVENNLVWMELSRNNEFIVAEVLDLTNGEITWNYDTNINDLNDVIVFRAHITEVSEDSEGSFVVVEGLYLIDSQDVLSIEVGEKFGVLEVDSISNTIEMYNAGPITLSADETIEIVSGINLQVADSSTLRYYPFVEKYLDEDPFSLTIESFSPSTLITGFEDTSQIFEIGLNQPANITWILDGASMQLNSSSTTASYSALAPSYGEHTVQVLASNENNSVTKEWKWIVQKDTVIVDNMEFRSSIISDSSNIVITAVDFPGFWYDLDDDLCSELLAISDFSGRIILEDELTYNTSIIQVDYEADFASEDASALGYTYPLIGLFGEEYIPTADYDAGELVKLLVDSDDKHIITVGSAFELPNGFSVTPKQLDVEGDKVWMEFSRDGELIESEVLDLTCGEVTWDCYKDVGSQDDVIVSRLLITDVFQGTEESIVVIEGIYLLDYLSFFKLKSGDKFGELEVDSVSHTIEMSNSGPINLTMGQTVDLAENLKFKVADSSDLRFYLLKECTDPGTYKLRGNVATGAATWDALNFAGFLYDLDDDLASEVLVINTDFPYSRTIPENGLVYNTTIMQIRYAANFSDEYNMFYNATYPAIGLFGEKYVSLSDTSPDKLVKLLADSNEKHVLRSGSSLELPNGFSLTAKQFDVEGEKVWMELSRNGEFIEDEVLDPTGGEVTWDYDIDVSDQSDVIVFRAYVTEVSEDPEGAYVVIEGLYLVDYQEVLSVEIGDEFGELEVDSISNSIKMYSNGPIVLGWGEVIEIASGMNLQVADSSDLRYYPFVEYKIEENVTNTIPTATIVSISPNPAKEHEYVFFSGNGFDTDGYIVAYNWTSSIDGQLSNSSNFSSSDLSVGNHTIFFSVQDGLGSWSHVDSINLKITEITNEETILIGSSMVYKNSSGTMPIELSGIADITGCSFDLLYNSSIVVVENVYYNNSFTGIGLSSNIDNSNGVASIALTCTDPLTISTSVPVIYIDFNVTGNYGDSTNLDFSNVELSSSDFIPYSPNAIINGSVTIGIEGDFNDNGRVDIGDVSKVAFMVVNKVPEDLNADFNSNDRVDIGDASKIAFYLAGKVNEL